MQRVFTLSAASQALLLVYFEVVEWVNLYPWNDVRRGNGQGQLDIGLIMLLAIVATQRRWRPGIAGAAVLYLIWLALQIVSFWVSYVAGASAQWQRVYAANFARTVQWLPEKGAHLPPDANHLVLQLLLILTLGTTVKALAAGASDARHRR